MFMFKSSIKAKLIVSIVAISIIPMIVLFLFTYINTSSFNREQVLTVSKAYIEEELLALNANIDRIIAAMNTIMYNQYSMDNELQTICKSELSATPITEYQRLVNTRNVIKLGEAISYTNDYVDTIGLYIPGKYAYTYSKSYKINLDMDDWDEEYRYMEQSGRLYLSARVINHNRSDPNEKYTILSRYVLDPATGKVLGMLSLILNSSMFDQVTKSVLPWDKISIINSDGDVLFGNELINLDENIIAEINSDSDSIGVIEGNSNEIICYGSLNIGEWKLVSKATMSSFNSMYKRNIAYFMWIGVLSILVSLIISILLIRIFTKPIADLSKSIENAVPEPVSVESRYLKRNDEIGVLYRGFLEMVNKINTLIQDKYVSEIELLKSKMKNLVAQINSHFVFNTLETINCIAEIEEIENISIMSKSLGDMLRYSIDYKEDTVPLSSEISHITKYIEIQEVRFGKKINLVVEAEKRFLDHHVLKFMLQPIVENAIEHGLHSQDGPWEITISAGEFDGHRRVTIADNGRGIKPDKLNEIKNYLKTGEKKKDRDGRHHDIGLININERLKLMFGPEYSLNIESSFGNGTKVHIDLPM